MVHRLRENRQGNCKDLGGRRLNDGAGSWRREGGGDHLIVGGLALTKRYILHFKRMDKGNMIRIDTHVVQKLCGRKS